MKTNLALYKRIGLHALYWIVFSLVYPLFMTVYQNRGVFNCEVYEFQILALLFGYMYLLPVIYYITYYLIPKLFKKKRIALFLFISLSFLVGLAIVDDLSAIYMYFPFIGRDPAYVDTFVNAIAFKPTHLFITGSLLFIHIVLFISIKYLKEYFTSYFEKQELKQQINDAELKMLKAQLHPHFLFNTLNNIYSLSLDCKNPQVSQSIDRISAILRYSLYECNTEIVNLNNEIKIIEDYIELERMRYSNISIETSFPDKINNVSIIPLLLFTFVENAFKHGTSKAVNNKWIKLKLSVIDNKLLFVISNSKNPKIQSDLNNYTEGVGLQNAIKRLDLFYGSENYTLLKTNNIDNFKIELAIDLRTQY